MEAWPIAVWDTADAVRDARALGPVRGFFELVRGIPGRPLATSADFGFAAERLGLPDHLSLVLEAEARRVEAGAEEPPADWLASISFHDLCYGVVVPLSDLKPTRIGRLFGVEPPKVHPPTNRQRRQLIEDLVANDALGLPLLDKVAVVRGDPFLGDPLTTRPQTLLQLLASLTMLPERDLKDLWRQEGDLPEAFARLCPRARSTPPLSAREVLLTLRTLKGTPYRRKRAVLKHLFERFGRLEQYVVASWLRRSGRGARSRDDAALLDALGRRAAADPALLQRARGLVDLYGLARAIDAHGANDSGAHAALASLALTPHQPVGPQRIGEAGTPAFPAWVEASGDGVRLMLHKSGEGRVSAFTHQREDWSDDVPGLHDLGRTLGGTAWILDGELEGQVAEAGGARPATPDEVRARLRGEGPFVTLRYRAFDALFLDGQDLTTEPFRARRDALERVVSGAQAADLPLRVRLAPGQEVADAEAADQRAEQLRRQGAARVLLKQLDAPYALDAQSPAWQPWREPEVLHLAVTGAIYDDSGEGFEALILSSLDADGEWSEVGSSPALPPTDAQRLLEAMLDDGLLTGEVLEHDGRTGVELVPRLVATLAPSDPQAALRSARWVRLTTEDADLSVCTSIRGA